jgi:hypothetical protein
MRDMLRPSFDPNITAHAILDATVRTAALPCTQDESAQLMEWIEDTIQNCAANELLERDVYVAFKALIARRGRLAKV